MDAIKLDDYRRLLPINKHNLDQELEVQGEMLYHISEGRTIANSQMLEAKNSLARIEAGISSEARSRASKITVGELDGIVQMNRDRQASWEAYQEARAIFEQWDGLYESWKQRGFALKTLADLYIGNYFVIDSAGGGRSRVAEKDHDNNRRAIATARSNQQEPSARRRRPIID